MIKIFCILMVFLILFLSAGFSEVNKYSHQKKHCTLKVTGKVVNVLEEDSGVGEYSGIKVYRPVVNYEYEGQEYTYYHKTAKTSYKDIPVGMQVVLKINPQNPKEVVLKI